MAPLTGLQIQKLLPKTNCKECGSNTCLAFAMKLAAKKAELSECPYVSDEAKAILGAAAEPPVRTVTIGVGDGACSMGGETVMFRHEKTFVNRTAIGIALDDAMDVAELDRRIAEVKAYRLERVGEILLVDAVSVEAKSGSAEKYVEVLRHVANAWDRAIIARASDAALLRTAAETLKERRPLLASATTDTLDAVRDAATANGAAMAVTADNLDAIAAMTEQLRAADFRDAVIELRAGSLCEQFASNTIVRRGALKAGLKSLGYPTLRYVNTGNAIDDAVEAGIEIAKYGGIVVLPEFDPATFVSLLTLRQNIFTDPQKPIQVEPKVYAIGAPNENSPTFVTTNFSLTYFIVSGEIENSGLSAWLLVPECEGMSVLTAWAAGKFGGAKIAAAAKELGLESQTACRKLVIPGYVSQISGELEEALPGWKIIVGPQEAGDIESFIKNVLAA
ncbi:MAG TPA: acetyl-CoA decarbonylase/synthase complex subunit gamma [Candidatus Hydrogenedentes bacterium]|nr:acetyl-CoA decarbonylase/synthase complex subunit gamma [Candidatus Hydrogenedentota bacterium]HOS01867.1 acetyl-CoA decarbonylase/synthase complex subunit gamma [Candidatus Hydrogenedentota bacterium]